MPHTGLFILNRVRGEIESATKRLVKPRSVKAICLSCYCHVDASSPPDLEVIEGGVILYCRHCGARQAITDARFAEFWERIRIFHEPCDE